MQTTSDVYEITCEPGAYEQLKNALEEKEISTQVAEISMVPANTVSVEDNNTAKKIISMMEAFEDHDDVQNVYANFDIPEEIMKQLE
jgi:transcriptional/translational regulatory protein YebC/TACO1